MSVVIMKMPNSARVKFAIAKLVIGNVTGPFRMFILFGAH